VTQLLAVWTDNPSKHTPIEDLQGIVYGCVAVSLGLFFLNSAGLLTSGTAGLAFFAHYLTGYNFGLLFFLCNLPFYWLAWSKIGKTFTLKTFFAIALTSALTEIHSQYLDCNHLNNLWLALLGGIIIGFGILALYRHRASLGGMGILAIYIQEKTGFRAGLVQLFFDGILFVFALFLFDIITTLISLFSALILNLFVAINHRADRYIVST
jgi:uncharacterized membrane-anchored protein YitT (DUF2179 family)